MKDHPLLFTTESVIRILTCAKCGKISVKFPCCHCGSEEFCKTQTRRVPVERYRNWKVGEMIWGRESFQIEQYTFRRNCVGGKYLADSKEFWTEVYQREYDLIKNRKFPLRATSGRFMYKSLARIFLEITGLREERVQEISKEDAITEGLKEYFWNDEAAKIPRIAKDITEGKRWWNHFIIKRGRKGSVWDCPRKAFRELWDDINASRHKGIYAWDKNPITKVIEFKRVQD